MASARADFNARVSHERRSRIETLRGRPPIELRALPSLSTEKTEVLGKLITFTTYAEVQKDGRLLILVRSDEQRLLGMVSYGATDGFWVLPDGSIAEASDKDVLEYFG